MGRTACTEPQCLYKGCTLPFYRISGVIGEVSHNRGLLSCWKPLSIILMIYEAQCDALSNIVPFVVQYVMSVVQKYRNYRT